MGSARFWAKRVLCRLKANQARLGSMGQLGLRLSKPAQVLRWLGMWAGSRSISPLSLSAKRA
jgi:hypothetical protein